MVGMVGVLSVSDWYVCLCIFVCVSWLLYSDKCHVSLIQLSFNSFHKNWLSTLLFVSSHDIKAREVSHENYHQPMIGSMKTALLRRFCFYARTHLLLASE